MRFFLAAIVVIGHGFGFFLDYFDGFFPKVFPHPQSIAVVCFFYLSGFLIVSSQIRNNSHNKNDFSKYLFDRIVRIYTTLVPSLFFVAIIDALFPSVTVNSFRLSVYDHSINAFVKNLLLIPSMPYGTMRPIWSLMYEWWIYMVFGGLYFLRSNVVLAFPLIIAGAYYTFQVNARGEAGHLWCLWALGGICAYMQQKNIEWLFKIYGYLLIFLLLITAGWLYFIFKNAYFLPAGFFLCMSIFIIVNISSRFIYPIIRLQLIAKNLAGFSFSLFLTHYTVLVVIKEHVKLDGWMGLIIGFFASCVVAWMIAFFTEYKLEKIKNFIRKRVGLALNG